LRKRIQVVVYGGNTNGVIAAGGILWLEKITEHLTRYKDLEVVKIPGPKIGKNRVRNLVNAYIQGFKVLRMKPDVILLDAGKDGNAALSFLHTFLSRRSKIYLPLHHYEPMRIGKHNVVGNFFAKILFSITFKLHEKLWKEAPALFVVSKSAKKEIAEKLRIPEDKLVLTGNSIEIHKESCNKEIHKDIDFLCVGRIDKFSYLFDIWKEIRKTKPDANFHMAGLGKESQIVQGLEEIGNFVHHGIVSEAVKTNLYERSKVFIFPSIYEGFGIAVAEALSYGLPVVAWNLPVYEELWGNSEAVRKVEIGDYKSFAREAIYTLEHYDRLSKEAKKISSRLDKSWEDIARIVYSTIIQSFK
jgi:glycosyltransferase involved in cell wall biosynthesis